MRIAAYNVNGVNGRLANLLVWLEEAAPDIEGKPGGALLGCVARRRIGVEGRVIGGAGTVLALERRC
jgi:hypothetical protein